MRPLVWSHPGPYASVSEGLMSGPFGPVEKLQVLLLVLPWLKHLCRSRYLLSASWAIMPRPPGPSCNILFYFHKSWRRAGNVKVAAL